MWHDGGEEEIFRDGSEKLPYHLHQYDTYEIFFSLWKHYHCFPGHILWEATLLERHVSVE